MKSWYKQPFLLTVAYITLRVLSLLTWQSSIANQLVAAVLIGAFVIVTAENLKLAWLILLTEIILGGSSHFFELFALLLRTWMLGIFGLTWVVRHRLKVLATIPTNIRNGIYVYIGLLLFATLNGFLHGHGTKLILQDAILYGFFFLAYPGIDFRQTVTPYVTALGKAFLIGSAIFSTITFWVYSLGLGTLQDTYYDWFRNIAAGKITDLGYNFYRVVLPEHLFLVPAMIIIGALLMRSPKSRTLWSYGLLAAIPLALNFTRIYFVALVISFVVLFAKKQFKLWLHTSVAMGVLVIASFAVFATLASGGQTAGLEIAGLKASGITSPTGDLSGATRLAILPDALRQIRERPLFGSGLGTTVTFLNPVDNQMLTRTQFDWGYLELAAELGLLGLAVFLFLIGSLMYTFRQTYSKLANADVYRGLFAGCAALFIINITTPALFQGFGVFLFAMIAMLLAQQQKQSKN